MAYSILDLHKKVMKPGIYFNLHEDVYHSDLSLSKSGMSNLLSDRAVFWHNSPFNPDNAFNQTSAMKLGSAAHSLLLEPNKFEEEWMVDTKIKKSTIDKKLGNEEYDIICSMVNAIKSNKNISYLLKSGFPEVSVFWIDKETSVPCKARMDFLKISSIIDYKTTSSVLIHKLRYSIADYGYNIQAAFYLYGINEIKKSIKNNKNIFQDCPDSKWFEQFLNFEHNIFLFLWQEKSAPFIYRTTEFCERLIENGRSKYQKALYLFKENYEKYGNNIWPFEYGDEIDLISLDDMPYHVSEI